MHLVFIGLLAGKSTYNSFDFCEDDTSGMVILQSSMDKFWLLNENNIHVSGRIELHKLGSSIYRILYI